MKSPFTVAIEALVVGVLLVSIVKLLKLLEIPVLFDKEIELLMISGIIFHIGCEISGINVWYAKEYCKILG